MRFSLLATHWRQAIASASLLLAALVPAGAATWTTHGPYGGIADQIVVDPKTPTTIYEASRGGGVFKSTNRGVSWTRASTGLTEPLVYTLVVDPKTPGILYAAGGNGVFRSTDGAAHWTRASFLVNVRQLAIDPKTPTTLYAVVSQNSLFKSTNSGATWTSLFNQLQSQSLYCIVIDPVTPANVYVGGQGGVWRTSNGGASWTLSTNGLGSGFIFVQTLAINPLTPKILYAGVGSGLKTSSNAGVSWTAVSTPPNLTLYAVDPSKPSRLYGADYSGQIYASANSGATWAKAAALAAGYAGNVRTFAVDPKTSAQVYAGTDHGVFASSTSGAKWAEANSGLANTLVTSLAINPKSPTILYAGTEYGGIFKTTNGGTSWSRIYQDYVDKIVSVQIDPTTPTTLYAASSFGKGVVKSSNSGTSWTNPLPNTTVLAMAIDRSVPATLYAATGGGSSTVMKSMNSGQTWVNAGSGLPTGGALQANSLSALSGQVMLTDPSRGTFTSTNAGAAWTANDPTGSANVFSRTPAARSASDPQYVYNMAAGYISGVGFGLFLNALLKADKNTTGYSLKKPASPHAASPAAAATWTPWAAPSNVDASTCAPLEGLVASPVTAGTFYAGGLCGVLMGTNSGAVLAPIGTGLPVGLQIDTLAVSPNGKTIYAGVFGGGVYSLTP